MYGPILAIMIFWVAMWFATRKLRGLISGHSGPRDIREEDSLVKRIAVASYGVVSPVGNPSENLATIFAFGRKDARIEGTATVFRATAGWRYGYVIASPFLMGLAVYIERTAGLGGQTPLWLYALIFALLIYTGVYIWRFRLAIEGTVMTCTTGTMLTRQFDLTQLIRAQTKQDGYTLYFADRRKIAIPRFVEGHDVLRDVLIGYLDDNGY